MRSTGLRERKKEDKERRILKAAGHLFRTRGFETTTVREIAAAAEVGLGTLYSYARSKYDLLELISRDDLRRVEAEAFAGIPPEPLTDQLLFVFRCIYDHHGRDPALAAVIVKELSFSQDAGRDDRRERFLEFIARLGELVGQAQLRSELDTDVAPFAVAMTIFSSHFFYLTSWLGGSLDRSEVDRLFEQSVRLILRDDRSSPDRRPHEEDRTRSRGHGRTGKRNRRKTES